MEKKFNVGDKVLETKRLKKRAAGESPNPLLLCEKVTSVVEDTEGYRYHITGSISKHTESELTHRSDIRRVALEFLTDCILDVSRAVC